MWSYIFKRILVAIPTLLIISFMIFSLLYITPGDPVLLMLGSGDTQSVSQEQYDAVRAELGLDKSYITGEDVFDTVMMRMPATLILTVASVLVGLLVAVPLGILAAVKHNSIWDSIATFLATIGVSLPKFWFGLVLIIYLSLRLKIFPSQGMIPVVTVLGSEIGALLGGAVVTETIFSWPGVGRLAMNSIARRDYPMIQGNTLILCAIFLLINLFVDIIYAWLNPRIRLN